MSHKPACKKALSNHITGRQVDHQRLQIEPRVHMYPFRTPAKRVAKRVSTLPPTLPQLCQLSRPCLHVDLFLIMASSSSATAPSSRTTRSSHTATAASSSMVRPNHVLREWSYPPVAPAIVLDVHDDSPQRESKIYTYPVATFVTNFVRHTVDNIYASVVDEQQQQHQQLQHSLDEAATLLDSSHPSAPATAAAIPVSPGVPATSSSASSLRHHDHHQHQHSPNALIHASAPATAAT